VQYEMQNFIKMTKRKTSNVGQSKFNDDWKRERDKERKRKQTLRNSVTNYRSNKVA
jgi:hypothetical protein